MTIFTSFDPGLSGLEQVSIKVPFCDCFCVTGCVYQVSVTLYMYVPGVSDIVHVPCISDIVHVPCISGIVHVPCVSDIVHVSVTLFMYQ